MIFAKPKNDNEYTEMQNKLKELEKEDITEFYNKSGWDKKNLKSFIENSIKSTPTVKS